MFGRLLASITVGVALIVGGVLPARADAVTDLLLLSQNPHKKPPPYVPGFALGMNFSGLENPFPSPTTSAEYAYFVAHGITRFRLPTNWWKANSNCASGISGFQNATFGPLDTTSTCYGGTTGYVGLIDSQIAAINSVGALTLLDVHMYGVGPNGFNIGTTQVPISAFVDLWTKLSAHYKGMPGIRGYDLMNEWVNGFDSSIIFSAEQGAINAIRANGDTTPIYIEGTNYSGAWNWVTGQGQPFNNSNLYKLVDPLNRLVFMAHGYLDNDSSGINFSWAIETAKPGAAPPGTPTSATIGVTRDTPFLVWARQHGVQLTHGETGGSNDTLATGGNDNYAAWNTALSNEIALAKANNYEIDIFSAGTGFGPGYAAYTGPSSTSSPTLTDFTSAGLQSTMMVMLEKYTGYSGPQPLAYRVDLPVIVTPSGNPELPAVAINNYGTVGTATGNFTIRYNGKITSPVTITPHDTLTDGTTVAGGTFTPATVTLPPGDNAIAYFTYTPGQAAAIKITATNNAGWIDPPVLGFSSIVDPYSTFTGLAPPTNVYGMYRRYTSYLGPLFRIQRVSDGAQEDVYPNNSGSPDRNAISAWAGALSGIQLVTWYDQSPAKNNFTCTPSTAVTVNLANSAGYPEVVVSNSPRCIFNMPANGQNNTSIVYRTSQASNAAMGPFRMDWFNGPVGSSTNGISLCDANNCGARTGTVTLNAVNSVYHEYAATWQNAVTNAFIGYKDAAAQTTTTFGLNGSFTATSSGTNLTTSAVTGWIASGSSFSGGAGIVGALLASTSGCIPGGTNIVSQTSGTAGGAGVYVTSQATTCSANAVTATQTINPGFASAQADGFWFQFFASTQYFGSITSLEFEWGQALTSGQITALNTFDTNYYSTPLPAINPAIGGTGASNAVVGQTATPFSGATVSDANPGATDSLTITLTGTAGGTLTGTGLSGSGPYTMASATPATITSQLRALVYTPTGAATTTETMTIVATSSAGGLTATNNSTVVTVVPPFNPVILGTAPTTTVVGKSNLPFLHSLVGNGNYTTALINVTDANGGGVTESAIITITGLAGGTLSGTGVTGTGPYTVGAGGVTLATLIADLKTVLYNPGSATATQTATLTLTVTNSAGRSATDSTSVVTVNAVAPAETSLPTPSGTFTPKGNFSGVNLSSAEVSYPSRTQFNYLYPLATNMSYWAGKGMGIIRMPITRTRLQPDAYGPLDPPAYVRNSTNCPFSPNSQDGLVGRCDEPAESAVAGIGVQTNILAIKQTLDAAFANGQYVLIDLHDFGDVYSSLQNWKQLFAGQANANGTEGTAQLVDFWQRMATVFKNYPNALFDVMNEPNVQTAAEWFTAQTAANNAIAAITTSHLVFIEGTCFSGGHDWVSCGNSTAWAGYVPPAGLQVIYEMHEYLDQFFTGNPTNPCTQGSSPMAGATSWGVTNGVKIFIGESGWDTDTTCMTLGSQLFSYMKTNDIANGGPYWGFTYWVGGNSAFYAPWNQSGAYGYSTVPAGLPSGPFTDAPQTTILTTNILH
jgi:hypothetical protein